MTRTRTFMMMLALLGLVPCSAPLVAAESEIRGSVRVEGWVPVTCLVSAPTVDAETDEAGTRRLLLTLKDTCNQGRFRVWLEDVAGESSESSVSGEAPVTDSKPGMRRAEFVRS